MASKTKTQLQEDVEICNLVFVYGTLKRGLWNHQHYLGGSTFRGSAHLPGYAIVDGGVPHIFKHESTVDLSVYGEIYEIDEDRLYELDRLEGVDSPYGYARVLVTLAGGMDAWAYTRPAPEEMQVYDRCLHGRWDGHRKQTSIKTVLTKTPIINTGTNVSTTVAPYIAPIQVKTFDAMEAYAGKAVGAGGK